MAPRKRLPKHWCESRDAALMAASDIDRYTQKIIDLTTDSTILKLASKSNRQAVEIERLLKELKFEPELITKAPARTEAPTKSVIPQ